MRTRLGRLVLLSWPWDDYSVDRARPHVAERCAEDSGKSSVAGVRGGLGSWPALGC